MPGDAVTNAQLDRVIAQLEKNTNAIMHLIDRNADDTKDLIKTTVELKAQLTEARADLHKLEELVRGTGNNGLSAEVTELKADVANLKKHLQAHERGEAFSPSSKYEKYGMYAAVSSGAIGGLYSILSQFFG